MECSGIRRAFEHGDLRTNSPRAPSPAEELSHPGWHGCVFGAARHRPDGPAKGMFAAAVASRERVLLVVPTDVDLERITADTRFFLSALEGLSDADLERAVLPFPSHEVDPYRGMAPHFEIASARARALHALGEGTARILIASIGGLLPRVERTTTHQVDIAVAHTRTGHLPHRSR